MPRHVAITGTATTSLLEAPWSDLSVDLWALPSMHRIAPHLSPRVNLWFDLHPKSHCQKFPWWDWALEHQPPVMLQKACPELKRSVSYPREKIEAMFGDYFTSSAAYMVALAVAIGFKEISIFGIDMILGSEYAHQRPCVEYLLGFARGSGVKVNIPDQSDLLKSSYAYGYDFSEEEKEFTAQDRIMKDLAEWRGRAIEAERKLSAARARAA